MVTHLYHGPSLDCAKTMVSLFRISEPVTVEAVNFIFISQKVCLSRNICASSILRMYVFWMIIMMFSKKYLSSLPYPFRQGNFILTDVGCDLLDPDYSHSQTRIPGAYACFASI